MSWDEIIVTGKKLHEEKKNQKLPDEVSLREFMDQAGVGKDLALSMLKNLIEAGLVTTRKIGYRRFYKPKS